MPRLRSGGLGRKVCAMSYYYTNPYADPWPAPLESGYDKPGAERDTALWAIAHALTHIARALDDLAENTRPRYDDD